MPAPQKHFFPTAAHAIRAAAFLLALIPAAALSAQSQIDRTTLPIPPPPFQGTITHDFATSTLTPPTPITAPKGAPNVLLILIDDAGYGQTATFGGIIPTPPLSTLAANGLRFTRFGVEALCSPTRAALLTGRNNPAVGMGTITNWSNGFPGYTASIPRSAAMLPEVLRDNGYATACIGKWHLIPDPETTASGPLDHWPTHQGCDYYYGFLNGETDQWFPQLVEGTQPTRMTPPPGRAADYTLSEDLANHAREWILEQKGIAPEKPVFLYFATGATHAPLQAPKAYIDQFKGKFDMGWDVYREQTFARQKALGVIPADAVLTPRPPEIPAWNSLTSDEQKLAARLMEVFAAEYAQADHEVGRVLDAFRQTGQLDNTLVIYIAGDNGASLEGGLKGTDNMPEQVNNVEQPASEIVKHLDDIGGPTTEPHYPVGWAWAGNTPFQWGKRIGSHLGGTRDPMVLSWPGHITDAGAIRAQYTHVIDIAPTVLEAAGLPIPKSVNGVPQQRMDGISLLYTLTNPQAPERHTVQYSEMMGNLSIYDHGWMAADRSGLLPWQFTTNFTAPPWELYNLTTDYSEAHNLATEQPAKLKQLQSLFDREAEANQVFPIDPRIVGRAHQNPGPPPGTDHFTYYAGTGHLPNGVSPVTINRTHTITATVTIPEGSANGVLVMDGGHGAGYSLYLKDGVPSYTYNYFNRDVITIAAKHPLPPGPATIKLQFDYEGPGNGKPATITLSVNGHQQATAHLAHTVPLVYSYDGAFDVGENSPSPVGPYTAPFPFTGTLQKLEIKSIPPAKPNTAETTAQQSAEQKMAELKN